MIGMAKLAKLTASAPVLLVKDVVAGANYYRDKMGLVTTDSGENIPRL
jgi:hypothetical protein